MSGLEIIGGIASVAALCELIIKNVSSAKATFKEFEELPRSIEDRTRYLDGLTTILQSIKSNKSLQTDDIIPLLEAIQKHIKSLNALLEENLKRVQHKSVKSLTHLFRKGESDKDDINQALVNLEHDKSNLNLFMLNKFGESVAQLVEMSNVRTLADYNQRTANDGQSGQRLGSSGDSQVKKAPAAADKRKWSKLKVSGEEAEMIAGDRNADPETIRARAEAGDDREWEELDVEGNKARGVFGDENDVKT